MNRLERIDRAVTRWTDRGFIASPVWLPDGTLLADLVAVARAVAKARAAKHRLHDLDLDIDQDSYDAAMEECKETMVDVFAALDPLVEEVDGE